VSAFVAAFGTEVDDPVSRLTTSSWSITSRLCPAEQFLEREQLRDVVEVQARGGLVEM
jgi:hypothetical protein